MADLFDLVDRLWNGEVPVGGPRPFSTFGDVLEVSSSVVFLPNFGNVTAFNTGDNLVMVDTGSQASASAVHEKIRRWSTSRLHTAIFSHGHIDHVFGLGPFDAEADERGDTSPHVIAHEHMPARFARYLTTAGYNEIVNQRQFNAPALRWPRHFRQPDETYRDHHNLRVDDLEVQLIHEKGETDDATVSWFPNDKILCSGDMFIWASPNAGNPQKVQRYPAEWAAGLRRMADLGAEILLPGHGLPIRGAARIHQALTETAQYLESLVSQTLALMNAGARLSEIVATVSPPAQLEGRPYLKPSYDEPEFIVHNIWRLYGGWWDGNPAHLKPAPETDLAREMAFVAGGASKLCDRAVALASDGTDESLRLAGHLIEWAWLAGGGDPAIAQARQDIYVARASMATSTMSRGVFHWAARESIEGPH